MSLSKFSQQYLQFERTTTEYQSASIFQSFDSYSNLDFRPSWWTQEEILDQSIALIEILLEKYANKKIDFAWMIGAGLSLPQPSLFFRRCLIEGILETEFPELFAAYGCMQDPLYHEEDVFDHTMRALDAYSKRLWRDLIGTQIHHQFNLKMALLFHDLGKTTTRREISGTI